jgi:hypothetical protein
MADDTTIFTSNHNDAGKIIRLLKAFHKISGLKTNIEKTIAYLLGPMQPPKHKEHTFGLLWETLPINLLGITITPNDAVSYKENFNNKIDNITTLTRIWSTINLSLKGKLTIINTILIPKLIYPATILETPKEVIPRINSIFSSFLWNWKTPKIKKDVIIRTIKNGGLKVPCMDCKIKAWKSIWPIRCLKNEAQSPLWLHLVYSMLPDGLTLTYLFKSRPLHKDLSEHCPNLPVFYKNIVSNWNEIKTLNLTTKNKYKMSASG